MTFRSEHQETRRANDETEPLAHPRHCCPHFGTETVDP